MDNRPTILVTRPAGQAGALRDALTAQGYSAPEQPLLELHKLHSNNLDIDLRVEGLGQYQHIIFISTNAVRFGMERILQHWPKFPGGNTVYAIGARTADMLRSYGLQVCCAAGGEMTSENLLNVQQLQGISGQRVLIVKGQGGRNTLRDVLTARGANVDELACYERKCPDLDPGELAKKISTWKIDAILLSSGEGFSNMLKLLRPAETIKLYAMPLIVPSGRVARMARDAGFIAVFEAKNATDRAMLEAVQQCGSISERTK